MITSSLVKYNDINEIPYNFQAFKINLAFSTENVIKLLHYL